MGASALDLELTVAVGEAERLECTLVYNTDLYDAATAERMLSHLMACPHPLQSLQALTSHMGKPHGKSHCKFDAIWQTPGFGPYSGGTCTSWHNHDTASGLLF